MTPEEMAYYKGCQDGRKDGKIAGYLLGLRHGKHTGLKMAHKRLVKMDIKKTECWEQDCGIMDYGQWLEQQIQELENGK